MMRLLVIDDHAVVRAGLRHFLADHTDIEIEEADCAAAAMAKIRNAAFDVVLELSSPGPVRRH